MVERTVAYTSPMTLGYLLQSGVMDVLVTCRDCSHMSLVPVEQLIERVGADRLLRGLRGRCSHCGCNRGELRPHRI